MPFTLKMLIVAKDIYLFALSVNTLVNVFMLIETTLNI